VYFPIGYKIKQLYVLELNLQSTPELRKAMTNFCSWATGDNTKYKLAKMANYYDMVIISSMSSYVARIKPIRKTKLSPVLVLANPHRNIVYLINSLPNIGSN